MTDKQIIIDGVDVSGCTHKKNDACMAITNFCGDFKHYCDDLNDCYYKQLQKLKAEILGFKILHESDKDLLKRKEQECEKLKETFDGLFKVQYKLADNNKKLRQCLTEIKEICNNNDELKGDFNLVDCDKYKLGKHNLANKILQKISEVENGN